MTQKNTETKLFNNLSQSTILSWPLGEKTILWLALRNKYILAEKTVAKLIELLVEGTGLDAAVQYCMGQLNVEREQAEEYVTEVQQYLNHYLLNDDVLQLDLSSARTTTVPASRKYYSIYNTTFLVEYENAIFEQLIHPKFEYLEIETVENPDHHFQVEGINRGALLIIDGKPIGAWKHEDNHFLGGKFSMQILQKIYQKEENEWMAVFHAAAVTNGNNCLMFLGDSGNGKSTLSAILMANGLEVLADDFLPVESTTGLVCHFPSAISIKSKAYELLIPAFPQLQNSKEIHNPAAGKTFRYLPTERTAPLCVPCKALIFVKYEQGAGSQFEKMNQEEAFAHLVPDSWISATAENADRFVHWFTSKPCYRMTYSNNEQMVETVKKMLNNDL